MGNHDIGRGMAALEAAAEDYIGGDAEFDDELNEETDLSRLVAIAFNASEAAKAYLRGEDDDDESNYDDWYENVYRKFRSHFRFS